jgi:DNA-binding response OmpR family regulator
MPQIGSANRVLIIEDDDQVLGYLSAILRESGLNPVEAPDGETALALVELSQIDLLLLDVHLPGMDGFEVLRKVKSRTPGLPVVMLTGAASIPEAVQAVKEGVDDYLAKPVAPYALLYTISRCLAARQDRGTGHPPRHKPTTRPPAANVPELACKGAPDPEPPSVEMDAQAMRTVTRRCPNCRSSSVCRSRFRGIEPLLLILLTLPFRCQTCGRRFWHSLWLAALGGASCLLRYFLVQMPWGRPG